MPADLDAFDRLATPLFWLDANGRITALNPAFASWLGVSARRLVGFGLDELDGGDRLAAALPRVPFDEQALRLQRVGLGFGGLSARFADIWCVREGEGVRVELHPVEEFPGDDPVTALPQALSASLRGLAHELRNPLAGLKGAAQLLSRRTADADSRELVGLIASEVERLNGLVDRILHPAAPRPFEPTNIHAVLERVRQLAEAEAGWSVKIVRDYDPSLPDLLGDADRLTQAVWNLVRNALESGASAVNLRTRAEHQVLIGDRSHRLAVRVEVSDDGRGVPEDLVERLFLPLVSGRAEGTGLGLPLAQQIAREHGGSLAYRSRPGHTVFTVLLPLPDPEAEANGAPA
jgi:two-component system nitrogen regulation sensor histidine kinase GlnL